MKVFWMVYRRDISGQSPTKEHETCEAAVTEACRLAEKFPDVAFVVLQAVKEMMGTMRVTIAEASVEKS